MHTTTNEYLFQNTYSEAKDRPDRNPSLPGTLRTKHGDAICSISDTQAAISDILNSALWSWQSCEGLPAA